MKLYYFKTDFYCKNPLEIKEAEVIKETNKTFVVGITDVFYCEYHVKKSEMQVYNKCFATTYESAVDCAIRIAQMRIKTNLDTINGSIEQNEKLFARIAELEKEKGVK